VFLEGRRPSRHLFTMAQSRALWLAFIALQCQSALGDVNVYGKPMLDCGSGHSGGCTYAAYDAGAHQVCVTKLPHGFSSDTGQGPWSDEFTGQPWCICIWAYSNYILKNKDLPLKCESIPSNVLEEQYSLDKFKACGSMSSTQGCGPEDIRRSIQSLCEQCAVQATDQDSKVSLKGKCDAILASAPAAQGGGGVGRSGRPQTLYSNDVPRTKLASQNPSSAGVAFCVAGVALVGISMITVVRRARSGQQIEDEESVE